MSYVASENHLYSALWTSIRTECFFRTLFNHLEALYKESQPALQLQQTNLHSSNRFRSKFKQYDVFNFFTFLQTNI